MDGWNWLDMPTMNTMDLVDTGLRGFVLHA